MSKPIIGISGSVIIDDGGIFPGYHRSYVNEDYVDSVVQNGGVPYIIPFTEDDETRVVFSVFVVVVGATLRRRAKKKTPPQP